MLTHQDGVWSITTPVYCGSQADVGKAGACSHTVYLERMRAVHGGHLIVQEQCTGCVAVRVKSRPAEAGDFT